MSDEKKLEKRIDNMEGGGQLGGTTFGQSPGHAGTGNSAKPPKDDEKRRQDEAEKSDED
jgi:hypothetical protein